MLRGRVGLSTTLPFEGLSGPSGPVEGGASGLVGRGGGVNGLGIGGAGLSDGLSVGRSRGGPA